MMRLKDKVAIVTGAARGLGRTFSIALAGEGTERTAIDIADVEDTVRKIESSGGMAKGFRADASVEDDTIKLSEETFNPLKGLTSWLTMPPLWVCMGTLL